MNALSLWSFLLSLSIELLSDQGQRAQDLIEQLKSTHRFACMAEGGARKSDRKLGKEPSFSHQDLELIEKLNREERKKKKTKSSSEVKQPSKRVTFRQEDEEDLEDEVFYGFKTSEKFDTAGSAVFLTAGSQPLDLPPLPATVHVTGGVEELFSDILEQGELSIQDLERTTTEREVSLRSFERNSEEEEGEALEMSTAPSTQAPAGSSHTASGSGGATGSKTTPPVAKTVAAGSTHAAAPASVSVTTARPSPLAATGGASLAPGGMPPPVTPGAMSTGTGAFHLGPLPATRSASLVPGAALTPSQVAAQVALATPIPDAPEPPAAGPRQAIATAEPRTQRDNAVLWLNDRYQNAFGDLAEIELVSLWQKGLAHQMACASLDRARVAYWGGLRPMEVKMANGEDVTPADKTELEELKNEFQSALKDVKSKADAVVARLSELDGQLPYHTVNVARSINDHWDLLAADFRSCCKESAKIYQRIEEIQKSRDVSKSVLDKPKCRTFDGSIENFLEWYDDVYSLIINKNFIGVEAAAMVINTLQSPVKEAFIDFNKELGPLAVIAQVKRDWGQDAKLQSHYFEKLVNMRPLEKEAGLKSVKKALREMKQLIVKYIQSRGEVTGQALSAMVYDRLPRYITERLRGGKAAYPEWNGLLSASDDIYLEKEANEVLPTRKEAAAQQKKVAAAAALPPKGAGAQSAPAPQGGEKKKRIRRKKAKAEEAAEAAVAAGVNVGKKPQHTKSKEDKPKKKQSKPCNGCPSCRNTGEQHPLSKCPAFAALDLDGRWALMKDYQICRACTSQNYSCKGKCPRKKETCGGVTPDGGRCQKNHHPLLHGPPKRN